MIFVMTGGGMNRIQRYFLHVKNIKGEVFFNIYFKRKLLRQCAIAKSWFVLQSVSSIFRCPYVCDIAHPKLNQPFYNCQIFLCNPSTNLFTPMSRITTVHWRVRSRFLSCNQQYYFLTHLTDSTPLSHFQSFLMNATQLFTCDGATKSPPGSGVTSSVGTNGSAHSASTPSSSGLDKSNPPTHVFIQGWMLMSLAISIFVPKSSKLLWFLRAHFSRNKDSVVWKPSFHQYKRGIKLFL